MAPSSGVPDACLPDDAELFADPFQHRLFLFLEPGLVLRDQVVALGVDRDDQRAELAHAVDILSDLEKVRKVEEVVEQTNEMLLKFHSQRASNALSPELEKRLSSRDKLLHELEKRAESIETIVWRELTASQPLRSAASDNTTAARR